MGDNDLLATPAGAVRCVWVFTVDLDETEIKAFQTPVADDAGAIQVWPLRDALGLTELSGSAVELFKTETLEAYGLARYLTEANGMDEESVAPEADILNGLEGHVLLVFSWGLPGDVTELDPQLPLSLVGRYAEQLDFSIRQSPSSAAAKGGIEETPKKAPSPAAMSGRVAMVALLVLFALVGLMIWVAG